MISLRDGMPLVRFESGEVAVFRRDWLVRSILRAAQDAGYSNWWLAGHVAESIAAYLQLQVEDAVVGVPRLQKAVQSVLQVIGYSEISSRFRPDPPILQISLPALAREAGHGFELTFFKLLEERLQQARGSGLPYIELLGLHECVKSLRARKQWTSHCGHTREEIVCFVRDRLKDFSPETELLFSVS